MLCMKPLTNREIVRAYLDSSLHFALIRNAEAHSRLLKSKNKHETTSKRFPLLNF